jgi:hypothetical protein
MVYPPLLELTYRIGGLFEDEYRKTFEIGKRIAQFFTLLSHGNCAGIKKRLV